MSPETKPEQPSPGEIIDHPTPPEHDAPIPDPAEKPAEVSTAMLDRVMPEENEQPATHQWDGIKPGENNPTAVIKAEPVLITAHVGERQIA